MNTCKTASSAQLFSNRSVSCYLNYRPLPDVNPLASKVFGKAVDMVYFTSAGEVIIGSSATFYLADGAPYPEGKFVHFARYDFNAMTCRGVVCNVN